MSNKSEAKEIEEEIEKLEEQTAPVDEEKLAWREFLEEQIQEYEQQQGRECFWQTPDCLKYLTQEES